MAKNFKVVNESKDVHLSAGGKGLAPGGQIILTKKQFTALQKEVAARGCWMKKNATGYTVGGR